MEVLKTFEIYLHQLIPEAIIRMNIFVWAVRSQGLEPNAKSFCNVHELLYETKPWGKEQYHKFTTTLAATASTLGPGQAALCQPFERGGPATG